MCGIVFTLSKPHHHAKLDDFMGDALLASQVRGVDSTGIFRVSHKPMSGAKIERSVTMLKDAVDATTFLRRTPVKDMVRSTTYAALTVGHVRAKTHGAVTHANAHPFEVMRTDMSELIGVHNGSLQGWKDLEDGDDYAVDSEWMYNKIAEDGIDAFKGFDGAYALVWYDSRTPEVVNIARNDKRPLFFAWTADRKGIVGASEVGMLGWIADRAGVELYEGPDVEGKNAKYLYFSPGRLYKFSLNTMEIVSVTELPTFVGAEKNPYKLAKPRTTPANSYMRQPHVDPYQHRFDQELTLKAIGDILESKKKERTKTMCPVVVAGPSIKSISKKSKVVQSEDLIDGADIAALTEGNLSIHGVEEGKRVTYAEGMSASSATGAERKLAQDLGFFGLVGYAWPYYHEEDTLELRCSFSLKPIKDYTDTHPFDSDAVLNFVKTDMTLHGGAYHDTAMAKMKFAVIGVRETKVPGKTPFPTLVLTPLTDKHRLIQRRVTTNTVAEKKGATLH